jgi:pilus assembly protein CpaB
MKQKMYLVLALVLAVAAVLLIQLHASRVKDRHGVSEKTVAVLVARDEIPRGATLDLTMIEQARIPLKWMHSSAIAVKDQEMIVGQTVVSSVPKGQPLLWSDIAGIRTAYQLSKTINRGQRAIAIAVDSVSGVAGHIRPDDWVDIIATFVIPREMKVGVGNIKGEQAMQEQALEFLTGLGTKGELEIRKTTLTLMQRVKVLAVGSLTGGGSDFGIPGAGGMGPEAAASMRNVSRMQQSAVQSATGGGFKTVTLLVSPIDAEILAFCADKGKLHLTLRNPEDPDVFEGENRLPKIIITDILDLERSEQRREQRAQPARPAGPRILDTD